MIYLIERYKSITGTLDRADGALSLIARFLFAAILMTYFWVSGLTKLGDGVFGLFQPALGDHKADVLAGEQNLG
jgi:putative oxidoreductase